MRKLKRYKDGGPKVKQRRGVRKNYDNKAWTPSGLQFPTSESSHLMKAEYIPERGWVAFPSLFQDSKPYANDQQNWVDMSKEEDWMKIYKEAERRGEVYDFGEDKEAALAFGEGSWKDQLPDEGIEVELTDEEVEQYRAGGYVLEELKDGGGTYTVKSGDTFNAIAYANGISPAELAAANPKISADKLSIGQVLSIPKKQVAAKTKIKVAKKSGVTSAAKKSIQSMPSTIDLEGLKKGIAHVESADGTLMMNPTSSATGLYGQLYNEIKDLPELKGITREQFAKNIDLQNKIFEKRFYEGLPGVPALQKNAEDLYKEYSPQIKNFGYSKEDIVALSNFLGRQGTRNYFGSIRDSKKFKAPGINKTPSQYLEGTRPSYTPKEEDGGSITYSNPPDKNPLKTWNSQQKNKWKGIKEDSSQGKALIKQYNDSIGTNLPHTQPWSAITISNAVMQNIGAKDLDSLKEAGFNPSVGHWSYVMDAFKAKEDPTYKYNRYTAVKPDGNYKIGDILVKGRAGTSKWSYEDFAKSKKDSYPSHGDIVVDKGTDDKGDFIVIAGGNVGDTYINDKIYIKDVDSKYKVKLNDNVPKVEEPLEEPLEIRLPNIKTYQDNTRVERTPIFNLFQPDNGFELDLTKDQVKMYTKGGYIVEEIPLYKLGGINDNDPEQKEFLQEWNLKQKNKWAGINENTAEGKKILKEYNEKMGVNYNPNDQWSAIAISNAVMADAGARTKDEIRALGFNPTKSHSSYVSDAFKTNKDPNYKYNKYIAERPTADLNYNVGDILVKGRRNGKDVGTSKWSYEDFATHGAGYASHGDIIVDKGTDDKGDYIILAGGNLSNTYKNKKVYTNNINNKYQVKLKNRLKTESLQNTDDSNTDDLNIDDYLSFDDSYQSSKKTKFNESMPIAQYSSSLVNDTPNNLFNNNALFSNNLLLDGSALGVAYTPYQNPFLNLENNRDEIINSNLSTDENLSSSLNENFDEADKKDKASEIDETDEADENNLEDESVKNSFNSRILKEDELHRRKYSKDQKNKIAELENEIKTLQSNMLSEINSISESEIDQASTKEEKKKAALKRYKTIMNLTGFNVRGEDANEIEAVTKKYKEKEEKLRSKLEQVKQEFDLSIEDSPINQEIKKYEQSINDYESRINRGQQWISVQDPLYKDVALHFANLYGGEGNGMVSLDPYSPVFINSSIRDQYNTKSSKNIYDNLAKGQENNKDKEEFLEFGKYYGDGSLYYGVWVDEDDYYPADRYLYPILPQDPSSYERASGRAEPMINLENAATALSYYIAPGFSLLTDMGLTDPDRYWDGYDPNRESQPIFGSVFKDVKENPQNYSQRPYKNPGFIESLPQIKKNIEEWPIWKSSWWGFEDGGYVVDLNEDEAAQYAQKGYIVEEIN